MRAVVHTEYGEPDVASYPLERAAEAHRRSREGQVRGKLVLFS